MKTLKIFLSILLLSAVLPSCGDDEPNGGPEFESYLSGTFTPSSEAKKLTATYNGTPVTAKEAKISLSSSDNTSGDFVIMNIVDSNKNLKVNKVPLKFNNEKYVFTFSTEVKSGNANVRLDGEVTINTLSIRITDK